MSSPRIVVLMSAFNEEHYITESLSAVLAQTMPDFHLLVLDNGSTDSTAGPLRRFAGGRVTVLHADRNLPPGRTANILTRLAMGLYPDCRWMVAAGADDVMEPDYLEAILDAAAGNPEANCIFSPWQWIGHPEKGVKVFPAFDPETCHAVHQIPAWSAITRELWDASGGHDETMIAADWDWVVRNRHQIRAHQLDRPYIRLRVREGARRTQSDDVHWPTLHRRFCEMVGKPVPTWAQGCNATC